MVMVLPVVKDNKAATINTGHDLWKYGGFIAKK
jgi:hypothetical protein